MKFAIKTRLYLAFALIGATLAACAALVFWQGQQAKAQMVLDQANLSGAAGLADAQSALWALRWSVPQFMVTDEAGRKKINDNEQTLRGKVEDGLQKYASVATETSEKQALASL